MRAAREINFVLIVLPSWNKVFIIIIIIISSPEPKAHKVSL